MTDEHILVPHSWRYALSVVRVGLALSCLLVEVFLANPAPTEIRLSLILYLLFAVVASSWRLLQRVRFANVSLLLDSLVFLTSITIDSPYTIWLNAAFYLYLMSCALLIHPWRALAIVACILPLGVALVHPSEFTRLVPILALAGALGMVAARSRQLLIDRLISASRKSVLYRSEALTARDNERERIAADFHDGPQQSFISLQMRLEVLRRILERDPEKAKQELAELQGITRKQVQEVRAFVRSMRPADIDGSSLTVAVSQLVSFFERDTGISVEMNCEDNIEIEDQKVAQEILQIVREALHNIHKHSGAEHVVVDISRAGGQLRITIQDDGAGFPFDGTYELEELEVLKVGPESIKRRVRGLNGKLTVKSIPEGGAQLFIQFES